MERTRDAILSHIQNPTPKHGEIAMVLAGVKCTDPYEEVDPRSAAEATEELVLKGGLSDDEKEGLAKMAYFFRHTMKRMNVSQSPLSAEDIANWSGADTAAIKMCRDRGIEVVPDAC